VKSDDGMTAFGHRHEHLVTGVIEEVVASLEPKELERGRISTRKRRPALTQQCGGKKWRGGPGSGADT
jgi:hypothetical protein